MVDSLIVRRFKTRHLKFGRFSTKLFPLGRLTGINSLQNIENLRHLNVSCNKFSDLSAVSHLRSLETLIIDRNRNISDIHVVSDLSKLKTITMYRTSVSDVSPLFGLKDLKRVNIGNNANVSCAQINKLRSHLRKNARVVGPKDCK